jgi:hypothetical protein
MTHLAQRDKTNDYGPFETWRNPATGEESQFISFPVVNGSIASEVTLAQEAHGQYMEWTFRLNNMPETTPETVTMTRRERPGPAPTPAPKKPGKTAVIYRTSPRLFIAVYVVAMLAAVIVALARGLK